MMELQGVSVGFGAAYALRDVSLTISRGERLGIVGESGSGKSMLGLAMMGMVPDVARVEGEIGLDGTSLAGASERVWRRHRARKVAMIFQEPMAALNPLLRLGEAVMEPLQVHLGMNRSRRAPARWNCSPRSASPTPRRACASIRTRSRAGSASGC
jgi:peptide/nickel transport system ATP-binding protein